MKLSAPAWLSVPLAAAALFTTPTAAQTVIPLNPRSTFIRTSQDNPAQPEIRTLAALSLAPGDLIRFRVFGEFAFNSSGQTSSAAMAVFSSSATVLAASGIIQRVPDAIEAGVDFPSGFTYYGTLPTDIPQDFRVDSSISDPYVQVVIPSGATHLIIGVPDSLYNDNTDTDADFAVEVSLLCAQNRCCGTSDFNGDGDFGTDADIEAFFSCLGGNCCAACFAGGSDFNGDGDFGTDADIESFFRVLGGGPC